jgi:hypothetical protein
VFPIVLAGVGAIAVGSPFRVKCPPSYASAPPRFWGGCCAGDLGRHIGLEGGEEVVYLFASRALGLPPQTNRRAPRD